MPRRALLIVNRSSRNGALDLDTAVDRFQQHGIDILLRKPDWPDQIGTLIRQHACDIDCVIVGGGDGSLNAAAAALVDTRLPLGVLPMGTANDLARTLKIPNDLDQASDVISTGLLHRIDLGRVNGCYFFNVANIGLGVHVANTLSSDLKQRWGIFSYAHSLVKSIRSFRPFHADIVCDARRRRVHSIQIAVGNGRHYGGGMTIAEEASIDDHRLFLYSVAPLGMWEMLRFAPALHAGRFDDQHPVEVDEGSRIEITTRRPMAVTADGEVVTSTPASFDVLADAIPVYVPAAYFDDRQEVRRVAQR